MLAFEQYPQFYYSQVTFDQDENEKEQYMPNAMGSYASFDSIPFAFDVFSKGQQEFDYQIMRQTQPEAAPSLLSSASAPSIPSASSSTVGSPYSIHAQLASNPFLYNNQFITGPAIVCDDSFPYGYESAHFDHEATTGQDAKLTVPFVGKCADLSSSASSSTAMPVKEFLPTVPLVSSPKPISTVPEATTTTSQQNHSGDDVATQIASIATSLKSHSSGSNAIFKSPTTPASAYPKTSLPHARRTICPSDEQHRDYFRFSYSFPFSSQSPMPQYGRMPEHNFLAQTSGNPVPPTQALYPVFISDQHNLFPDATYGTYHAPQQQPHFSAAASPAPSSNSYHSFSAPVTVDNFGQQHAAMRRQSISSTKSGASPRSSYSADEESQHKGRCPYPDCGRQFKDLKAHMLTHETVRPEKCPIVSCEYHRKGFARKYDKNRHTLTHYRGTMVCGFCPGSGSAAEKSFNRADVFKRHLTSVHGVEQAPPNSRKRSPSKSDVKLSSYCQDATGRCSTCTATFNNAQEFYEHLDDCVLKVVQQEDPVETINAQRLAEIANDNDLQATFERNHIKPEDSEPSVTGDFEEDDEEEEEDEDEFDFNERSGRGVIKANKATSNRPIIGGNISKKTNRKGLTWSSGGGSIVGKSRKRRKFYPPSWGMATEKMNMKKRVLCVWDGQRRLLKDDMMMHNEFEVRMPLADGNSYVTDLDMESMKRADAYHNATPAEKGPWIPEEDFLQEFLQ